LAKLHFGFNSLAGDLPDDFLAAVEEDTVFTIDLSNNQLTGTVHKSYDRFQKIDLYLEGNRIAGIDQELCDNDDWMSGNVGSFGCEAILCPSGTSGGRRKFSDVGCELCPTATLEDAYLGQVGCGKESSQITGERGILALFHKRMGGSGWRLSDNWNTDASICSWHGIDCDEDGSVASIQLGSNNLVGNFPTEIYTLPKLMHLKLHDNNIAMDFTGIENARNLQTLVLDNTGLKSLNGVGQARSLVELKVGHNSLSGDLPEELSRLINLRTLDVSHNSLSGFLPYWLRGLVSLTTLLASDNTFSGPMNDMASLSDLEYVDLSSNQLTGTVPPTLLAGSPRDKKVLVDLSKNNLAGMVPADIGRLSRLTILLQDNQITGLQRGICDVEGLNDYTVMSFGCDAILCPVGTWNQLGRQSNEDMPCEPCNKAKYMGSTHCGKSGATNVAKTMTISLTLAVGTLLSWMLV
jgi:hypothetical protein